MAEDLIRKSHNEINNKFNQRTKQMREYVEGQINEDKRSTYSGIDQSGSFNAGDGGLFGKL